MRDSFVDVKLYDVAMTHRSWVMEHPGQYPGDHYQRLEFLGDAVVQLVATELLYEALPSTSEGRLTDMRQHFVRKETLAQLGRQLGLGDRVRLGRGADQSGDREREKLLADLFESTLGAIYLDRGLEAARAHLRPLLEPFLASALEEPSERSAHPVDVAARPPVNLLQEWAAKRRLEKPSFAQIGEEGPPHQRLFTVEVSQSIEDGSRVTAVGTGRKLKEANAAAARAALAQLEARDLLP